jgi:hypothetical protein
MAGAAGALLVPHAPQSLSLSAAPAVPGSPVVRGVSVATIALHRSAPGTSVAARRPARLALAARRRPGPATHKGRPAHRRRSRARPAAPAGRTARWTPTGTGMWIYQWSATSGGNAVAVLRRSRLAGLSTLYVRTGSSWDGFTGAAPLSALLSRVGNGGPAIVAWDFPSLDHPGEDALRLARAARFGLNRRGWGHVVAVAPDIETPAEGTYLTDARVLWYLSDLRRFLPRDVSILATVPWPSRYRVGRYPYRLISRYADAFLPMAYWYDNSSYVVTVDSIRYLDRFGRPVVPVGQGYNEQIDDPHLPPSRPRVELAGFVRAAQRAGARGVSLWSWQLAGPAQWGAIHNARRDFPGRESRRGS